ncbi:MAG: DUF916 and DUF3324 domain-containing protein [Levilactobacillus sp.]|jgi:hypothetical protein|uniref:DUF916 domain-containing protein n=1 Tax=Levilactobacillus sp. TaxID=2767919 RepID=UPI002587E7CF|nr:DUF916 domain-containing protein [Levilactobacillus sp.]MCI1553081.1 DUF916 and DUF3324 domain-containing protein [Levilactobacillus sp.]MCI1598736.1 DUF916 and DUF3324 domain-containing protein [Levilactobacillus sp.]MCI1605085.1 DUF916 and DUF3324 domain-containing protein [Levilactobacillus sp.]
MMKLQRKWALVLALVCFTILGLGVSVTAQAASNGTPASFTVAPELPTDNAKRVDYFDFKVTPGQKRVLVLSVTNNGQKTNTFDITPRIASTNTNGILDYGTNNTNAQLPAQLKQIMTPARTKSVKVLGKHTVKVPFKFTAPAKRFSGVMLGGFTIAEHGANRRSQAKHKATGVVAHVQYVIGLEFYNQRSRTVTAPVVKFRQAHYGLAQARPTLRLGMANQTRGLVGQGKLRAKLTNSQQKVVKQFTKEQMTFAPQSNFNLNLDLENKQLAAGTYTLAGTLTAKGGYSWRFQKQFTVTNAQVANVKKHAANFGPQKTWKDYLMDAIVVLAVLVLLYELYKWLRKHLGKNQANQA